MLFYPACFNICCCFKTSQQANSIDYSYSALAFISAQLETKTGSFDYVRDSDYGVGLWVSGGVIWTLTEHFNIGFDVRVTGAEVTIFEATRKAGGFHSGLILGYHW